jgi:hypothetical protein
VEWAIARNEKVIAGREAEMRREMLAKKSAHGKGQQFAQRFG